jgi:hypothetical protein
MTRRNKNIPAFKLIPEPLTAEAKAMPKFRWAPPEVGTRHQLGGIPKYLQKAECPVCPSCGEKMTFYAQLDSINDSIVLADCGMIYVFVCFDCFTTHAMLQSN